MSDRWTRANSLNHACTLLSERYEGHRISHTVNVYKHVFYQEAGSEGGRWYPLDQLRNGVVAGVEESIRADAWARLEERLGSRLSGKQARQDR